MSQNTHPIILIGSPDWADTVIAHLQTAGYTVKPYGIQQHRQPEDAINGTPTEASDVGVPFMASEPTALPSAHTSPSTYIERLTDDLAALLLIDGNLPDWEWWATVPRTSPATRRIPVIVVGSPAALSSAAERCGVDRVIAHEALLAEGVTLIRELARIPDMDMMAQLDCQCRKTMPEEGLLALEKFNAGEYYEQHDRFEHLWMVEQGPVRDLYRAILQVGVAYYQVTRGNLRGARKMLLRSIQWLALLPEVCQGVDVAQLRRDADAVRAELDRVGDHGAADFDRALLKGVNRVTSDKRARGA